MINGKINMSREEKKEKKQQTPNKCYMKFAECAEIALPESEITNERMNVKWASE